MRKHILSAAGLALAIGFVTAPASASQLDFTLDAAWDGTATTYVVDDGWVTDITVPDALDPYGVFEIALTTFVAENGVGPLTESVGCPPEDGGLGLEPKWMGITANCELMHDRFPDDTYYPWVFYLDFMQTDGEMYEVSRVSALKVAHRWPERFLNHYFNYFCMREPEDLWMKVGPASRGACLEARPFGGGVWNMGPDPDCRSEERPACYPY